MANNKKSKKFNSAHTIFSRFLLIVAFFIIWIGAIGARLVHLQVNQSEWLRGKALDQRRDEVRSKQLRGTIYDRDNRTLASSVKVQSLYANPSEIEDFPGTAQRVAAVLKTKPAEVLKTLQDAQQKGKRFVWLARKLDQGAMLKLNEQLKSVEPKKADEPRVKGLHWREEQKRSYPNGALAAQIIGFSNLDDVGQAGVEMSQEEHLHGATIKTWQDRDRLGRVYDESEADEVREPPKDIALTISNQIQYKVEEALRVGVENARAKSGMAIVMNPRTGEILAMANYPTFDPNKFAEYAAENYTNRAIQNLYAPGSVFKLVTYGSALQENLITPSEMMDCGNGTITVAGREFRDPHCERAISYTDAMAVSSNIGAIKTALRLGKDRFYHYERLFGFGEATGIELPAEARGQIRSPDAWNGDSLASMSIGYEIGVTALQSASAFAIIANDGIKTRPHIIKEIRQADGKIFYAPAAEKQQVVSPETARNLRLMLQRVVLKGTGKRAALNGYTSAGKTGTAWKYDPKLKRVSGEKYVASFIGMAPANNPEIVIAVVMDEPQAAARNGGDVSAPVFRSIAEQILPDLGVVPDRSLLTEDFAQNNESSDNEILLPNIKNAEDKQPEKSAKGLTEKQETIAANAGKKEKPKKPEAEQAKLKTIGDKSKPNAKNKSSTERAKNKT